MDKLNHSIQNLRDYWKEQATMWAKQEKAWHDVAIFCRQVIEELKSRIKNGVI